MTFRFNQLISKLVDIDCGTKTPANLGDYEMYMYRNGLISVKDGEMWITNLGKVYLRDWHFSEGNKVLRKLIKKKPGKLVPGEPLFKRDFKEVVSAKGYLAALKYTGAAISYSPTCRFVKSKDKLLCDYYQIIANTSSLEWNFDCDRDGKIITINTEGLDPSWIGKHYRTWHAQAQLDHGDIREKYLSKYNDERYGF